MRYLMVMAKGLPVGLGMTFALIFALPVLVSSSAQASTPHPQHIPIAPHASSYPPGSTFAPRRPWRRGWMAVPNTPRPPSSNNGTFQHPRRLPGCIEVSSGRYRCDRRPFPRSSNR